MSFSSDVKEELSAISEMPPCCVQAQGYGMLLFGKSFNINRISLMTEHGTVAKKFAELIKNTSDVDAEMKVTAGGKFVPNVRRQNDCKKVLEIFSVAGNDIVRRINYANLQNESNGDINCCEAAFLRGAFLSAGTVSDPNKGYHLEFAVPYLRLSQDLMKLMSDIGLAAKKTVRRGVQIVYFKDSGQIEDLLTVMGATMSSLELMSAKVYKDVRNSVNRKSNFEAANLSKTVDASVRQIKAIEKIDKATGLETLPEELRMIARLRLENPEMNLKEMGESVSPKISRSGVNHRLRKLIEISESL